MLPHQDLILRLAIAALMGSAIGIERERLAWAAGLRTHMLVCVGACLAMIVSAYGFSPVLGPHVVLDPSRVAAQVVSGVGFLGAGSIILRNEAVKGLTTAASLWAVAAVGLAVGGGLYLEAGAATAIVLVILAGIKPLEERFMRRRNAAEIHLDAKHGVLSLAVLQQALGWRAGRVKQVVIRPGENADDDEVRVMLETFGTKDLDEMIERLAHLPSVSRVRVADDLSTPH